MELTIHQTTKISIGEIEALEVEENIDHLEIGKSPSEKEDVPIRISYHRNIHFHQGDSVFTVTLFAEKKEDLSI